MLRQDQIEPKPYLEYHPCYYYNFECARLILPLNYNATNPEEQTIALAVIRIPAHVAVTDPRYGGAVYGNLLNTVSNNWL